MNHDAPETLEAACSRIADLEQQLRLSDEGVSRLGERCLALEQELLTCQAELARQHSHEGLPALFLPHLFYSSGSGFSERESLTVPEDAYDETAHEVTAAFELPADAHALRLDPGEVPCCITDLAVSDDRLTIRPTNGIRLQDDCAVFLDGDPNLILEGLNLYPVGMKIVVTYHYYPLDQTLHGQPGSSLLDAVGLLRLQAAENAQQTDQLRQQLAQTQQQLAEMQQAQQAYEASLESVLSSSSWKLTSPLRRLLGFFHGKN